MLPVSLCVRKRLNDRRVLNRIVRKFRTGTAWQDVPEQYGPWTTPHTRFRAAQPQADTAVDIDWLVSIGSVIVRAHGVPFCCARATGRV